MIRRYLSALPQVLSTIRAHFAPPDPKRYATTAPPNWHRAAPGPSIAVNEAIKYTPDGIPYRDVKPEEKHVNTEWHLLHGETAASAGRVPHLTGADMAEIKRLGFRETTAVLAKSHWAAGRSAAATALTMNASQSTVEKMFAAFGRAAKAPTPAQ